MYTGWFTLDSPLYLTDFHIVTNSVCGWACVNFYFLAIPLFVICWFFALSVLLENLLFFYCCEGGWYLVCWTIRFVAFVKQLRLISPYEKGWNLNGGQEYKRHISFSTCGHCNVRFLDDLKSLSKCIWTTCLLFTWWRDVNCLPHSLMSWASTVWLCLWQQKLMRSVLK